MSGPKSKKDKRVEALERMERKGPVLRTSGSDAEYGAYLHRRLDEIEALRSKIGDY